MMKQSPSQTVGPFFYEALIQERGNILVTDSTEGQRIRVEGRVLDGNNDPISDAMIEIWQANTHGRYNHPDDDQLGKLDPDFKGYGRSDTDEDGNYWFESIKPGSVSGLNSTTQAPHLNVIVFSRGMLVHAFTRMYFANEVANGSDPVLLSIEDVARRNTLIANSEMLNDKLICRFDIHLQGANETVFFDA